jgi:5'-deoxynucleotidase YfbR-like HD superfamily hydrolase
MYRQIPREIHYKGKRGRELNGEHAFQLAFVCWFVNHRFRLGFDEATLLKRALAHDFPEMYARDTPAFAPPRRKNVPRHDSKRDRELRARNRLAKEWETVFPDFIDAIDAYMNLDEEVDRFVSAMDKLVAIINVYTDNGRSWRKLGVTIETMDLYKRPRVAAHTFVSELYEELFARMSTEKRKLFALSRKPVS